MYIQASDNKATHLVQPSGEKGLASSCDGSLKGRVDNVNVRVGIEGLVVALE